MSKLVGRSRLSLTAMYRNGVPMVEEQEFIADIIERKSAPLAGKTVLAFVVPDSLASSIKTAMVSGDVELLIEGITPPTERHV